MRPPPLFYIDVPTLRSGTIGAYAFAFACTAVAAPSGLTEHFLLARGFSAEMLSSLTNPMP
jgi:hypothetical protein